MELLCARLKKEHPSIGICEVNLPNKPDDIQISSTTKKACELTPADRISKDFSPLLRHEEACELFLTKDEHHDYKKTITMEGLSPFWAQEYIGSDLLQEDMEQMKVETQTASEKLAVWDTSWNSHGDYVSNLILGPSPSAVVKGEKTKTYRNLQASENYILEYENLEKNRQDLKTQPRFINNSMGWINPELISKVVGNLTIIENAVIVTAAGNDYDDLRKAEPGKVTASHNGHAIVVSSHSPDGLSSDFTNYGEDVDITAPSDEHILSFDEKGEPKKFGGTSGATPLVTGSLLSFELISGIPLSTKEYKTLLKKTAIKHGLDPERKVTGAGYLNAYKLGQVAFRLRDICGAKRSEIERKQCAINAINTDSTYNFKKSISKTLVTKFAKAFPECSDTPEAKDRPTPTCEEKKSALKAIRKASFLVPEELGFWKELACASETQGFKVNAEYYGRLAHGKRITEQDLKNKKIAIADVAENKDNPLFVRSALKNNGLALQFESDALKKEKATVLTAVTEDGRALQFASDQLKMEREVVLAAGNHFIIALQYASDELKKDKTFALEALKRDKFSFYYLAPELQSDPEVRKAAGQLD